MKKSTLRRARIARERRNTAIIVYVILAIIFMALARISAPTRKAYNARMMCMYGYSQWCGEANL